MEISDLLVYNVALVISDGITARVGSLTANKERFMPWNTIKNEDDRPLPEYQLEKVVRGYRRVVSGKALAAGLVVVSCNVTQRTRG